MASNSLMSIKALPLLLEFHFFCERSRLFFGLLLGCFRRSEVRVGDVHERLVRRKREFAVLVDALLTLLDLLGRRLARSCAQRSRREIDPELLRGAKQLVLLL